MSKKKKDFSLDDGTFFKGIFKRNEKGFGFVDIGEEEEIFIAPKCTMNAMNGDTVLIKLFDDFDIKLNRKREGKVITILEHGKNTLVGVFKKNKNFGFVIPDDKKFSDDIYISKKNFNKAVNDEKVVVKITKFSDGKNKAEGKIIERIGKIDQAGVDILSLVKDYRLPYEFPENVIKEAKEIPETINENSFKNRLDLRNEEMFTIDGEDAKDLDDAVCVSKNEDGTYNLGVHIADVSNYVKAGSYLDKEAILRGTSIYLMDRVIPMLPKELSNGICSLNEGKDRFALSALMKIDKKGKVIEFDIKKTLIRVTKRMNYHDVNDILKYQDKTVPKEDKERVEKVVKKYNKYINHFLLMRELKDILKEKRDKAGSLNLDIPESKLILDKNGICIDVKKYDYLESNEIIEQFMLIANESVAEKFYWLQAPFIYRVHEVPELDKIDELNKFLMNLGYKIKGIKKDDKDSVHPKAFATVLDQIKGKEEEKVISNLILRTLKVARYEKENKGHFGIASKCYCHFTSPIRRYPDLFIHRVISSYIDANYNIRQTLKDKYEEDSAKYAELSSERERVAQKVERDAEDIKKAEYMHEKIGEIFDGIVSSITQFGMFVELDNTVEGLITFDNMGNEYFVFDEERKTLTGEHSHKEFKVGDSVKIQVVNADKLTRKIDFKLIEEEEKEEKDKNIKENKSKKK